MQDFLPPDIAERFLELLAAPGKDVRRTEYRLIIDGEPRDFEARLVPAGEDEMVVIVRDFTDRRRLEDELSLRLEAVQREQDFTRAVVNVAPVIFLLIDPGGGIVRFNDQTERLFGIRDDDTVRGKPWWDVFLPEENRPGARAYCRMMNAGADQLTDEAEWVARDGRRLRDPRDLAAGARRRRESALPDLRPGPDRTRRPAQGARDPA